MAYSPSSALTFAKSMVKKMPIDTDTNVTYQLLDYPASMMWQAAPWRWTVGEIPTIAVVGGTSDYTVSPPADLQYVILAQLTDAGTATFPQGSSTVVNWVTPVPDLTTPVAIGTPTQLCYGIPSAATTARVSPLPPPGFKQTLSGVYKKVMTPITVSNYTNASAQVFPDVYFPVYQAGVLWMAYLYADDERAGAATVDQEGKTQFTGQLGVFQGLIAQMRRQEKLLQVYPGQPKDQG